MEVLAVFIYILGNVQDFTQAALLFLLRFIVPGGLFLGIFALAGLVLDIRWFRRFLPGMLLSLVLSLFGIASALGAAFILIFAGGTLV
jgi:hypothetical protein